MTKEEERDFQFGWSQILSCLVADRIVFNSQWNRDSFLDAIPAFVNRTPDKEPKGLREEIEKKCQVLYFPIRVVEVAPCDVYRVRGSPAAATTGVVGEKASPRRMEPPLGTRQGSRHLLPRSD